MPLTLGSAWQCNDRDIILLISLGDFLSLPELSQRAADFPPAAKPPFRCPLCKAG